MTRPGSRGAGWFGHSMGAWAAGRVLAGLAIAGVLGCGGLHDDTGLTFGFDTSTLEGLEVESILVEAFDALDVNGDEVACDRLLANPADTSDFVTVAPSLLEDVVDTESSLTLVMPTVPPGPTWFLVAGFSAPGGGGRVNAAGCGHADIERGQKATVVVRMEEVE